MSNLRAITVFTILILLLTSPTILMNTVSASSQTTITIIVKTREDLPLKNAIVSVNGSIWGKTDSYGKITHTYNRVVNACEITIFYVFSGGHNLTVFGPKTRTISGEQAEIYVTADVVKSWPIRVWDHAGRDPVPNANVTIIWKQKSSVSFWKILFKPGFILHGRYGGS